jgi:tripartite-type tricarboxylate transporter receptor subunit TctC
MMIAANAVRAAACALALLVSHTLALNAHGQQNYPERPIRFLVPFPAGGAADTVARTIGEQLVAQMGQPVVIDNRPGAGGRIATDLVAKGAPDGYTLLLATVGGISVSPALYRSLPYNVERDLAPVTRVAEVINVMVVNPNTGVTSVKGFVDWARKRGETRYGSAGTGQPEHLAAELLRRLTGLNLTHVPYKGGGPALVDLISGDIQLVFATYVVASPHVQAGRLRALAVSTPQRQPLLPDLPAVGETVSGFGLSNWEGVFAPKRTPPPLLERLHGEINKALAHPELKRRQNLLGIEPVGSRSREEFAKFVREDAAMWARIVKEADIRLD